MRRAERPSAGLMAMVLALLVAACTGDEPTARPSPTQTVTADATPEPSPAPSPERRLYVAVAQERAGSLAVLSGEPLEIATTVDVPAGPHNMASDGPVVLVTHPGAGRVSRLDVASGKATSASIGTEPHDVAFSADGERAYVTDESGRALVTLDPGSLEIVDELSLPGQPHDLVVRPDGLWVTLLNRDDLAHVRGEDVQLVGTGRSPHDLVSDRSGDIWFSNWDSDALGILDPATGEVRAAPAGVVEAHHFTIGPDGGVWVSDNGGGQMVGFRPDGEVVTVEVGPVPHHLDTVGDRLVVAVSAAGEAAVVEGTRIVHRLPLSTGLHGVAAGRASALAGRP